MRRWSPILITLLLISRLTLAQFNFVSPDLYPAGEMPQAIATGHLDQNGTVDVVVANYGSDSISLYSGNGHGDFVPTENDTCGSSPIGLALGDFNNDNKRDVLVANYFSSCTLLLGNGDATLQTSIPIATAPYPYHVAAADFNNDGNLDAVVVHRDYMLSKQGVVAVLMGNGNGTFAAPKFYTVGNQLTHVATGLINADAYPDLVITDFWFGGFFVMLGNGDGTFQESFYHDAQGANSQTAVVADFNGDGFLDVVTANHEQASLSLLYGDGNGEFTFRGKYAPGSRPFDLAVADLNNDGRPDLVAADLYEWKAQPQLALLRNNGDGFSDTQFLPVSTSLTGVAVGDFNANGAVDFAVARQQLDDMAVYDNTTTGVACYEPPPTSSTQQDVRGVLENVSVSQTLKRATISAQLNIHWADTSSTSPLPAQFARVSLVAEPTACAPALAVKTLKIKAGKLDLEGVALPILKPIKLKYKGIAHGLFLRAELDVNNAAPEASEEDNIFYFGPL